MQVSQFLQEHPTRVLVVGWEPLVDLPNLIEKWAVGSGQGADDAVGRDSALGERDAATVKTEPVQFATPGQSPTTPIPTIQKKASPAITTSPGCSK